MQKVTLKIDERSNNNNTKTRGTLSTSFMMRGSLHHPFVDNIMEVPLLSN